MKTELLGPTYSLSGTSIQSAEAKNIEVNLKSSSFILIYIFKYQPIY